MRYLFDSWGSFAEKLKSAPHVLLLSDYDGTLTPIVSRPELAVLPAGMKDKLRALAGKPGVTTGIVSGRSLAEVKKIVGVPGIYYAGNHGLEIEGPALSYISGEAEEARSVLEEITSSLRDKLGGIEGVIIEDKGLSLSIHYRLVDESRVGTAREIFDRVVSPLREEEKVRVTLGKKVWEVRPPIDWHKGKAVAAVYREIKKVLDVSELLTIYLGDDTTDEDAFREMRHLGGWGIYVGGMNAESSAEYYLNEVEEVAEFLSRVIAMSHAG